VRAERRHVEPSAHERSGAVADDDRVRRADLLKPGRYVHRAAERPDRFPLERRGIADHDEPGLDPDPTGQAAALGPELKPDVRDRLHQAQPCADRANRIVFVRFGEPEVDDQSVAEDVGDPPAEALDDVRARVVVLVHDVAVVLGIEQITKTRRSDQIAEKDGYPAAFAGRLATIHVAPDVASVYAAVTNITLQIVEDVTVR